MTYKQRYYKEIFFEALQNALNEGLISHSAQFIKYIENKQDISNFYAMILSIHSEVFEKVYSDMTEVYNSFKINNATGIDLDDIGDILGCPRPQATHAGVEIRFKLPKVYSNLIIEGAGIEVTSPNGITYKTVEDLKFPAGETVCTVFAYATKAGPQYGVDENQLTKIISSLKNIDSISCTNINPSTGGTNVYNDNQYRELLQHWFEINQKGNYWAYVNYFARTDAVEGYKLIPNWDGTGTLKIIIDPGDSFLLNRVYDELTKEITQVTEDIVLMEPVLKPIDIYINANVDIDRVNPFSLDEKVEIQGKIKQAVIDYIDLLKIGEDFIPHKCSVYIDKDVPELQDINFQYPTGPVVISDEEQCSPGDIQIIME